MWRVETTTSVTVAASPVVLHSVRPSCAGHQTLHYCATSGANVRGGVVHLVWDEHDGLQWFDKSTDSLGTTSALTFSAGREGGGAVTLWATSSSGTWSVELLVVSYERSN